MKQKKYEKIKIVILVIIVLIGCFFAEKGMTILKKYLFEFIDLMEVNVIQKENNAMDNNKEIVNLPGDKFIAHAGGEVRGEAYTSSLEALNESYVKGFRFFEVDLNLTSDNKIVLLHDWNQSKRLFNVDNKIYSLQEYKNFKMIKGLTQLDLASLIKWLSQHNDAYIVTDVKQDNVKVLDDIRLNYPTYVNRFIPQIYKFREYDKVKRMGYNSIILTLYVKNYHDYAVIRFAQKHRLFAITMWDNRAFKTDVTKLNAKVYAHTVNDFDEWKKLKAKNVYGIYTDKIFLKS